MSQNLSRVFFFNKGKVLESENAYLAGLSTAHLGKIKSCTLVCNGTKIYSSQQQ